MSDLNDIGQKLVNAAMLDTLTAKQEHIAALERQAALSSGSSLRNDQTRKAEARASLIASENRKLKIIVDRQAAEIQAKDVLILDSLQASKSFAAIASLVRQEVMSASSIADLQLSRDPVALDRLQKFFEDSFRSEAKQEPKYKPEEKTITEAGSGLASLAIISAKHGGDYSGEHSNGNREGRGKHVWPNGTWIEGTWCNDVLTGHATHKWADGCVFVGNFDEGVRNGKGRDDLSGDSNNPKSYLDGEYKLGYFTNGEIAYKSGAIKRGTFEWAEKDQDYVLIDGEETALDPQGQVGFKGVVKNRQRISGYFKFGDGTSFEGDLLEPITGDGTQQRQGTLKLPGVEVVGKFIGFGTVEGVFTAKFVDGSIFDGEWAVISADNLLSCDSGTLLQPDGSRVKAIVVNGVIKKKTLLGGIFG